MAPHCYAPGANPAPPAALHSTLSWQPPVTCLILFCCQTTLSPASAATLCAATGPAPLCVLHNGDCTHISDMLSNNLNSMYTTSQHTRIQHARKQDIFNSSIAQIYVQPALCGNNVVRQLLMQLICLCCSMAQARSMTQPLQLTMPPGQAVLAQGACCLCSPLLHTPYLTSGRTHSLSTGPSRFQAFQACALGPALPLLPASDPHASSVLAVPFTVQMSQACSGACIGASTAFAAGTCCQSQQGQHHACTVVNHVLCRVDLQGTAAATGVCSRQAA